MLNRIPQDFNSNFTGFHQEKLVQRAISCIFSATQALLVENSYWNDLNTDLQHAIKAADGFLDENDPKHEYFQESRFAHFHIDKIQHPNPFAQSFFDRLTVGDLSADFKIIYENKAVHSLIYKINTQKKLFRIHQDVENQPISANLSDDLIQKIASFHDIPSLFDWRPVSKKLWISLQPLLDSKKMQLKISENFLNHILQSFRVSHKGWDASGICEVLKINPPYLSDAELLTHIKKEYSLEFKYAINLANRLLSAARQPKDLPLIKKTMQNFLINLNIIESSPEYKKINAIFSKLCEEQEPFLKGSFAQTLEASEPYFWAIIGVALSFSFLYFYLKSNLSGSLGQQLIFLFPLLAIGGPFGKNAWDSYKGLKEHRRKPH